jgi:hypothetical protein
MKFCRTCGRRAWIPGIDGMFNDMFKYQCSCRHKSKYKISIEDWMSQLEEHGTVVVTEEELA